MVVVPEVAGDPGAVVPVDGGAVPVQPAKVMHTPMRIAALIIKAHDFFIRILRII